MSQIVESALSCLSMLASDAHGKAEHMDRLCESKVVETAMRLLEKDGWNTMDDKTLPVRGMILSSLSLSVHSLVLPLRLSCLKHMI